MSNMNFYHELYNIAEQNSVSSESNTKGATKHDDESFLLENLTDLPSKSKSCVLKFMKDRINRKEFYTWAGQILIAVHPFCDCEEDINLVYSINKPSINAMVEKAWFKFTRNIGKQNQAIVFSGESGSGKTFSACLALKCIADKSTVAGDNLCQHLLWQAWASVPLLTAFGNAPTEYNNNSSRFGKLLELQYDNGKIIGAYIQTYLLEKSRVSGPNINEGNFHIFYQVLESLDEEQLNSLCLSKNTSYNICPAVLQPMVNTYDETLRALKVLHINDINSILTIIAIILNLGNIKFNQIHDVYNIKSDSLKFIENASKLLKVDRLKLSELLTKRVVNPNTQGRRRLTCYKSPCIAKEECQERLNCLMRLLYNSLFNWIVEKINRSTFSPGQYKLFGILDIYGFEVFANNTFEQLCINYANERLQQYFIKDYLLENANDLISEGFVIESIDISDYSSRVSLLDGTISVFSILNEECLMKRFTTESLVNSRITSTLKNRTHFIPEISDYSAEFSIRHFAGAVTYNSKNMVAKNRDKIPKEMVEFLIEQCKFPFLEEVIKKDETKVVTTLLKKFKNSLDCLLKTLDECDVQYVKCVKQNSSQVPGIIEDDYLLDQLRMNGVFEILKLNFQGYAIKLNKETVIKMYSVKILEEMKYILNLSVHIGNKLVYLTENAYHTLEKLYKIKTCFAARIIQKAFRNNRISTDPSEDILEVTKKNSNMNISVNDSDDYLSAIDQISPNKKVQEYVDKHSGIRNYEGDPISLALEKVFEALETVKIERTHYFGDGIVSCHKLLQIPIRIRLAKSCIPFSHYIPNSELPKGLQDAL